LAQALAKEPSKRFPSANDLLKALTRVMQPSTDEEVAEYVRGLLQDRLEKRRKAVRAALEIADEREELAGTDRKLTADVRQDDVATVVHRTLPASLNSVIDNELDSAPSFERQLEDSMSGSAAPPTRSETLGPQRARSPAVVIGAAVGITLATLLAVFTWGGDSSDGGSAASRSVASVESAVPAPRPQPAAGDGTEPPAVDAAEPAETGDAAGDPSEVKTDAAGNGAEGDDAQVRDSAAPATAPPRQVRRGGSGPAAKSSGSTTPPPRPTATSRGTGEPFVTPVRDPGF
jgi:hypothetical protein